MMIVVPPSRDPEPSRLDPPGVVLSMVGLVSLVYGIIQIGEHNRLSWVAGLSIAVGVVVLAVFVVVERRSSHPAFDVELFKNPSFSAASAAITLAFFALFGATFFLTFFLQFARAYTPFQAGIRLLPIAVAIAVFAPLSSRLVLRFGAKAVCTAGLVLVAAAFSIYQVIDITTSIWVLEGLLLVQGIGLANVMAPATTSIQSTLPRERAGAGSAVNNTARQVGGALGVAVLGSVLGVTYSGRVGSDPVVGRVLAGLPAGARDAATSSIGGASQVAARLREQGQGAGRRRATQRGQRRLCGRHAPGCAGLCRCRGCRRRRRGRLAARQRPASPPGAGRDGSGRGTIRRPHVAARRYLGTARTRGSPEGRAVMSPGSVVSTVQCAAPFLSRPRSQVTSSRRLQPPPVPVASAATSVTYARTKPSKICAERESWHQGWSENRPTNDCFCPMLRRPAPGWRRSWKVAACRWCSRGT